MIKTEYNINGSVTLKLAIVADLHEFNPTPVLNILKHAEPDIITVPGDLLERHEYGEKLNKDDTSHISKVLCGCIHLSEKIAGLHWKKAHDICAQNSYIFLREASKIAPVVMSLGNHELYLTTEDKEVISSSGVHCLNNTSVKINNILFGGIPSKQITGEIDENFMNSFSKENAAYKILLCHHPEYYDQLKQYNIDMIIACHCHGGQIRLFGFHGQRGHGIFSPGQGLFPKYHHGIYDGKLIVSSGCANTSSIPRFGNPTEVVIVNITGCKD